jgi:hypothetical protein
MDADRARHRGKVGIVEPNPGLDHAGDLHLLARHTKATNKSISLSMRLSHIFRTKGAHQ